MYKRSDSDEFIVNTETGAHIPANPYNADWQRYQAWLAEGNTPGPAYSLDELMAKVSLAIEDEANTRVDAATSSDPRAKRKALAKSIRLLRKELKGTASPSDLAYLNAQEAVVEYIEALEATAAVNIAWVQNPARTEAELEAFDPASSITWPTLA
ncbi:MAG: hypothetical protein OEV73_05090 [Desulfobulbaceae bacterium]|nr:hypothetical protein [Desulfobulbaceae bacterium]